MQVQSTLTIVSILSSWPPVTISETEKVITQMKSGKASNSDSFPTELIKSDINWWSPGLAALFTYKDQSTDIPNNWSWAIIFPIF